MRLGGQDLAIGDYTGGAMRRLEIAGVAQQHPIRAGLWAAAHCAPAFSSVLDRVGRAAGYDPVAAGEAIANLLLPLGASMADLDAIAAEGLRRLTPARKTQPEPVQAPQPVSSMPDPYPGLRLWGKSYPEWVRTVSRQNADTQRLTWADCGTAIANGQIAEVVAQLVASGVPATWEG